MKNKSKKISPHITQKLTENFPMESGTKQLRIRKNAHRNYLIKSRHQQNDSITSTQDTALIIIYYDLY